MILFGNRYGFCIDLGSDQALVLIYNLDSDLDRTSIKQAYYFTDLTLLSISLCLKKMTSRYTITVPDHDGGRRK
jgi:hypothetical protein